MILTFHFEIVSPSLPFKKKAKTYMWQILKDFKDIHHITKYKINNKASFNHDNTTLNTKMQHGVS